MTVPSSAMMRRALVAGVAVLLAACGGGGDDGGAAQPVFVIPEDTGGYFANPANKYIAAGSLAFDPDRVVVVRGRAAIFPNTYEDASVFAPANGPGPVELRYWSMCNNVEVSPYPVVRCVADYATAVDADGFYTYVLAADESGTAPSWLPPGATWLPWGPTGEPNILIFRNMLPAPGFEASVQAAAAAGCTVDNAAGNPASAAALAAAGACARTVMGAYYPVAAYCAPDVLLTRGWRGCFAAAGVD